MTRPLADRLRPQTTKEIVGQNHLFGESGLLTKITKSGTVPNLIFYGPPGTGKTTAARIMSQTGDKRFYKLNATTASLADIKKITAEINPVISPNGILLYLDEIQYFNKKQQQSLLEFMENGLITLIASTTENPYFCVYNALLSRSQICEFKLAPHNEILKAVLRGIKFLEKENSIKISASESVTEKIASLSCGDIRKAINMLEVCFLTAPLIKNTKNLNDESVIKALEENSFSGYNKTGDEHFDLLSAFQKSMRGSDPDASIYYLARLLKAGELISVCRRLLVCAAEDVGLAYPGALPIIKSLCDTALQVGMPEARIPLADAVILVAVSPKSNSAYKAINAATQDIERGNVFDIPRHLKNVHCDSSNIKKTQKYIYPHNYKNHRVTQQYLPDEIKNKKYYYPDENKNETAFKNYWKNAAK